MERRLCGFRLAWADLPTHCRTTSGLGGVPAWNQFSADVVDAAFTLAAEFLVAGGMFVAACRVDHLPFVSEVAADCHFELVRTVLFRLHIGMYASIDDCTERVCILSSYKWIVALYS